MEYSNNHDSRLFNPAIDAERKAMDQHTPSISMNDRVPLWCFSNRRKNLENHIKEFVAQT